MGMETPQKLSPSVEIGCYCCERSKATYRCRYKVGELQVQICLCATCVTLDQQILFEQTIGLPYTDTTPN